MKCRYCEYSVPTTKWQPGKYKQHRIPRTQASMASTMRNHIHDKHPDKWKSLQAQLGRAVGEMRFVERTLRN